MHPYFSQNPLSGQLARNNFMVCHRSSNGKYHMYTQYPQPQIITSTRIRASSDVNGLFRMNLRFCRPFYLVGHIHECKRMRFSSSNRLGSIYRLLYLLRRMFDLLNCQKVFENLAHQVTEIWLKNV